MSKPVPQIILLNPNHTVVVMRILAYYHKKVVGEGWAMYSNQLGNSKPTLIKVGTNEPLEEGHYDLHIYEHRIAISNETIQ